MPAMSKGTPVASHFLPSSQHCLRFGIGSIRLQGCFLLAPYPSFRSMKLRSQIVWQWTTPCQRLLHESRLLPLDLWLSVRSWIPMIKIPWTFQISGDTSPGPNNISSAMLWHLGAKALFSFLPYIKNLDASSLSFVGEDFYCPPFLKGREGPKYCLPTSVSYLRR